MIFVKYRQSTKKNKTKTRTSKNYKLLNLPYFLSGWLEQYLVWFCNNE
jgi:hypothetical protein